MTRGPAVDGENDVIVYARTGIFGQKIRMGRRTAAHLDRTITQLAAKHPNAELRIIQGAYNTTIAASAGTHDRDAVLDVEIDGLSWQDAQRFLRECGWGAWWRHTGTWAKQSAWHIHMISLGCTGPLGKYIDGGLSTVGRVVSSSQIADYYAHSFGLAGQHTSGADHSWFPRDIATTVFNYSAYLEEQDMPISDDDAEKIADKVVHTLLKGQDDAPKGRYLGASLTICVNLLQRIAKKVGA